MERFTVGTVVITQFPFSDLRTQKYRPAIVLAIGDFEDLVMCQVTSFKDGSTNVIELNHSSFEVGSLKKVSYARPDKLFTGDPKLVLGVAGKLTSGSLSKVKSKLRQIFDL